MVNRDLIVIGAGAAGLMCAWQAAARGLKVALLERAKRPGRKILMSGGGRCNFTNLEVEARHFLCENPHYVKSALKQYSNWDFIGKVIEHGIAYHERDLGKLFCDDSAKDILDMLLRECEASGVELIGQCQVQTVDKNGRDFLLHSNKGVYRAPQLVVATGGLSIPSMGGGEFGYQIAEQFGLQILPTRAGLVPFTFSDAAGKIFESLAGIAIDVTLSNDRASFSEAVLFTHRGLSGPASLQLSNYWYSGESICMDILPNLDAKAFLLEQKQQHAKTKLRSVLRDLLPKALIKHLESLWWEKEAELALAEFSNQRLEDIAAHLNNWVLKPSGTEGYRTAEVTLGGVDCRQLSSKTMEAETQKGLFFIGEVVDVTGHLGGFNFQWAWSSAYACAQALMPASEFKS
ncbi:NAD(P)/FAD-dependent oxidoreductase [Pseudoteredinibacter isoporae]|uniref:NAD(P)/FAD-dependent oxidoreductase n=1 Tax=Pseudoteredinibacter isoporae TaxID=570281 RepID=UPI0031095F45